MSLAETVERAFELARQGPEPFDRLLEKVEMIWGSVEPWTFDDVLADVGSEGEGGTVRSALRTRLARWDHEDTPAWGAGTARGTAERRERIYDLLRLAPAAREVLSDRVPFFRSDLPVVIEAERWEPWYGTDSKTGRSFYWDGLCRQLRHNAG